MKLRIPHRDLDERLTPQAIADLTSTLPEEDRVLTRELFRRLALAGAKRVGDAVIGFEELNDVERKSLIGRLRRATRRESPEEAKTVIRTRGGWSEWQACPACGVVPVNPHTGILEPVSVKRWWCSEHAHLSQPGDLAPLTSGLRIAPGGALVEYNPAEVEREEREAKLRQGRHEEEMRRRRLVVEQSEAEQAARDASFRSELPPGVGG